MHHKKIGTVLLVFTLVLALVLYSLKYQAEKPLRDKIAELGGGESCDHPTGEACPHQELSKLLPYTYFGFSVLILLAGLGVYLIIYGQEMKKNYININPDLIARRIEKSLQKNSQKEVQKESSDEKFSILLTALDKDEQNVLKAVKDQDGISQSTLKFRTDLSKTKLSLILTSFEKKNLITKVKTGKINHIYLKKAV